jgi:hypothetical protein
MRPKFDERDQEILDKRLEKWNQIDGPRVGDFIRMLDGSVRRFAHKWDDSIQPTSSEGNSESFYLPGGGASYSGGLDPAIPLENIKPARVFVKGIHEDETKYGRFWFFHHGYPRANNAVYFQVSCRVFVELEPDRKRRMDATYWEISGETHDATWTIFRFSVEAVRSAVRNVWEAGGKISEITIHRPEIVTDEFIEMYVWPRKRISMRVDHER